MKGHRKQRAVEQRTECKIACTSHNHGELVRRKVLVQGVSEVPVVASKDAAWNTHGQLR